MTTFFLRLEKIFESVKSEPGSASTWRVKSQSSKKDFRRLETRPYEMRTTGTKGDRADSLGFSYYFIVN
jgi:hypothetical protein